MIIEIPVKPHVKIALNHFARIENGSIDYSSLCLPNRSYFKKLLLENLRNHANYNNLSLKKYTKKVSIYIPEIYIRKLTAYPFYAHEMKYLNSLSKYFIVQLNRYIDDAILLDFIIRFIYPRCSNILAQIKVSSHKLNIEKYNDDEIMNVLLKCVKNHPIKKMLIAYRIEFGYSEKNLPYERIKKQFYKYTNTLKIENEDEILKVLQKGLWEIL
mgnify:CR=1 FL=1